MDQKTFSLVAGIIFLAVAAMHLSRILMGWEAAIAGWQIPLWVSWAGVGVAGYLGYQGVRRK